MTRDHYRVLVVEDDVVLAKAIDDSTKDSLVVEHAGTLADAVDRLIAKGLPTIDALLVDLTLPNGRGLDVVRKLHMVSPDIPMVILTGGSVQRADAIAAGACEILYKPAMPDEIIDAIAKAIATDSVSKEFAPLEKALKGTR